MKVRVIATGEIIDVIRDTHSKHFDYYDGKMLYKAEALEFIDDDSPDYWTRLEHQYAGMAMQGILAHEGTEFRNYLPQEAVDIAHALVEKLKEKEERK